MTAAFVAERNITQLVHFTTDFGMIGILMTRALKATAFLKEDERLEFVYRPNSPVRKDTDYLHYVNLSIEEINSRFFEISSGNWHAGMDGFWCIIALDPMLVADPGVKFATTNNMYTGVKRAEGRAGLEALYAPRVVIYNNGRAVTRTPQHRPCDPTCPQAEVLYPTEIPTSRILRVYVKEDDHASAVEAQCVAVGHDPIEVVVAPEKFRRT